MTLRLEIISRQRQSLRTSAIKEFGPDGGTIGRSLQTDWPLPDAQRFLSSQHASIDFRSGSYYIVDTSTNGVYINGAADPVGKGKPQRLFTGDIVRIGEYEMKVSIDTIENTMETLIDNDHVDPVETRQRVEQPDPTGHDLIDAFEITGVGIEILLDEDEGDTLKPLAYGFDSTDLSLEDTTPDLQAAAGARRRPAAEKQTAAPAKHTAAPAKQNRAAATAAKPAAKARQTPAVAGTSAPANAGARSAAQSPPAPSPAGAANGAKAQQAAAAALIEAFCSGAGIDPATISDEDPRQVFARLGETFGALLAGVTDSLRLRSLQKAELRQTQTIIQRSDNNLLKFSANANEALARLLAPQTGEYLDPVESVRDAFADLNAHQRAVLRVLPKVLNKYLQQLDPDELEDKFASAGRSRLIGAANKLRYWDLYRDVYLVMSQQAEDELPAAFTEMLGAEFEKEIASIRAASDAAILARKVG